MKPFFYLLAITTLLYVGCTKKKSAYVSAPSEVISFQKYTAIPFQEVPQNLIKRSIFINLEMNKDKNYVGLVTKVSVVNNKIYILDRRQRKLVIYGNDGKYVGMIDRLHKDYANLSYFDVGQNGTIYIIDGKLDNFLTYDPSLRLTSMRKSPFEIDIVQALPNNTFLFGLSSWNKQANAGDKVVLANYSLNATKAFMPYDEYVDDNYWISDYRFIKTDKSIFYNKSIDNNVYVFSLNGVLQKVYHFDFGPMNVPNNDKKDIQANMAKFDKYRLLTDFTIVNDKYIIGKILDHQSPRFFYLDKVNDKLYLEDSTVPGTLTHIADFDGKHLFTFIYPGEYDAKAFANLPDDSKKHLQNGGIVICDYELN